MARKRLIDLGFIAVLCTLFVGPALAFDTSECVERTFVVTAYYSPESGQAFYYKPSYEEEKILNGEGYCGASGKDVFNGMLAGPASYDFGTIIYWPSLGVGEVADRGGAIVQAGEKGQSYDRIDIWMGKGEEGLVRALTFGKKTLSGYLCTGMNTKNTKVGLDFGSVPVLRNFFDISLWIQQLSLGRNDVWTWTLQKYLTKLGYLNQKYWNGKYDIHTKNALCAYQVKTGILRKKHPDCGLFGKATRYQMKLDVQEKNLLPENLWETITFENIIAQAKQFGQASVQNVSSPSSGGAVIVKKNIFQFYRSYTKNQHNGEIEILQKFLQSEKLFSGKIDGIYSQKVMSAVFEFQKKYGILSDKSDASLKGYLGPSTRKKMNELRDV